MESETMKTAEAYESVVKESLKHELFGTDEFVRSFAVLTAENPMTVTVSREMNKELNDSLEETLKSGHYVYRHLNGQYGSKEHSYLIVNISIMDAKRIAAMFGQQSFIHAYKSDNGDDSGKTRMTYRFFALRDGMLNRCRDEYRKTGNIPQIPLNAYVQTDSRNGVILPKDGDNVFSRKNSFRFRIPFEVMTATESETEKSVVVECKSSCDRIGEKAFMRLLNDTFDDSLTGKYHYQCRASLYGGRNGG